MSDILNGSPAASPVTSEPSSTPAQGQPADGGGWLASLPEDLKGVAEHKGWKDPADALRSYQHLEQTFGADRAGRTLVLPKDGGDSEGYEKIYSALGRPDDPTGYELTSMFGEDVVDESLVGAMSKAMHDAGLSKTQAQKIGEGYQELFKSAQAEAEAAYQAEVAEVMSSMPQETIEQARRGFRLFRLPPQEAAGVGAALERALGVKAATELFARLGMAAGEDRPVTGAEAVSFGGDPKQRIDQLLADKDFSARYLAGDRDAKQRIDDLYSRLSGR